MTLEREKERERERKREMTCACGNAKKINKQTRKRKKRKRLFVVSQHNVMMIISQDCFSGPENKMAGHLLSEWTRMIFPCHVM